MLLKIEETKYSEFVHKIGILTLILNNLEFQLETMLGLESGNKKTLGQKLKLLEESDDVNLLYWEEDIISGVKEVNDERLIFIHGCSFINPHTEEEESKIEFYKDGENKEFNISRLDAAIVKSKDILEKLLCIHLFYKEKTDESVPKDVYNDGLFKKIPFTFYPDSKDKGIC